MRNYNEIVNDIIRAPDTWVAAFFIVSVEECLRRVVFMPKAMENILRRCISDAGGEKQPPKDTELIELTCGRCCASYTKTAAAIHSRCGLRGCKGTLHKI